MRRTRPRRRPGRPRLRGSSSSELAGFRRRGCRSIRPWRRCAASPTSTSPRRPTLDQAREVAANVGAGGGLTELRRIAQLRAHSPRRVPARRARQPGRRPVEPLARGRCRRLRAEQRRRTIDEQRRDLVAGVAAVRIGERARFAIRRRVRDARQIERFVGDRAERREPRADGLLGPPAARLRSSAPWPDPIRDRGSSAAATWNIASSSPAASFLLLASCATASHGTALVRIEPRPLQRVDQLATARGLARHLDARAVRPGIHLRIAGVHREPRQRLGALAVVEAALLDRRTGRPGSSLQASVRERVDEAASGTEVQSRQRALAARNAPRAPARIACRASSRWRSTTASASDSDWPGLAVSMPQSSASASRRASSSALAPSLARPHAGRATSGPASSALGASLLRSTLAPFGDVDQQQDEHDDRQRDHDADIVRRETSPGHAVIVATATRSRRISADAAIAAPARSAA